eukprot:8395529-Pyramimonas_sp.AAC.1
MSNLPLQHRPRIFPPQAPAETRRHPKRLVKASKSSKTPRVSVFGMVSACARVCGLRVVLLGTLETGAFAIDECER